MQLLDVPRFAPALMDLLRCLTLPHGRAAKAAGSANANDRCPVHSDPSLDDVDDGGATEIAPGGGRVRVNNGNGNGTGQAGTTQLASCLRSFQKEGNRTARF